MQGNGLFNAEMELILAKKGVTTLNLTAFPELASLNATISSRLTSILGDSLPSPASVSTDGVAEVAEVGGAMAGSGTSDSAPARLGAGTASTAAAIPTSTVPNPPSDSESRVEVASVGAGIQVAALSLGGPAEPGALLVGRDARGRSESERLKSGGARTGSIDRVAMSALREVQTEDLEETEEHERDSDIASDDGDVDGSESHGSASGAAVEEVALTSGQLVELMDKLAGFIARCRECVRAQAHVDVDVPGSHDDEALKSMVLSMTTALYPLRYGWTSKCIPPDSEHALVNYWFFHSLDLTLLGFMQQYPQHVLCCKG